MERVAGMVGSSVVGMLWAEILPAWLLFAGLLPEQGHRSGLAQIQNPASQLVEITRVAQTCWVCGVLLPAILELLGGTSRQGRNSLTEPCTFP
jgi:hypothetical protein